MVPGFTSHAARGIDELSHLVTKLELRALKTHIPAWRCFQNKPEVDVYKPPLTVETMQHKDRKKTADNQNINFHFVTPKNNLSAFLSQHSTSTAQSETIPPMKKIKYSHIKCGR
jgi:hypothetical protein